MSDESIPDVKLNRSHTENGQPPGPPFFCSLKCGDHVVRSSSCDNCLQLDSEIHREFRAAHSPSNPHAGLDATRISTGVIWATERANQAGFSKNPETWANLGQGAPEAGDDIEGSFKRPTSINISLDSREYGPTTGIKPLREAVARLYNEEHRQGKSSKYTYENVCIVPGGRAGLIRIAAVLNNAYLSFFTPDYTAYNEMLTLFKTFSPIPTPLVAQDKYHISLSRVSEEIARGASVILTSNPRNPTGQVMTNPDLAEIQDLCRGRATLIMDEFYGGYNYTSNCDGTTISSASNLVDVDKDDVVILDGLTKRFRLPGFRIAWILGPKAFISALASSGSYLDGGSNVALQEAALPMLEPSLVQKEMVALQKHFKAKRDYVLDRLEKMGFNISIPEATFYIWLDLSCLPDAINDGLKFFAACLQERVIVIPGFFFDLNPNHRRNLYDSPAHRFVRLSYGPRMEHLVRGMDGIQRVLEKEGFKKKA